MQRYYPTIRETPENLRPYEKCLAGGPGVLSNEELLAVIIRTGTNGESASGLASRILSKKSGSASITDLMHLSMNELMQIKGVGKVKAIQIQCICELSRRIAMTQAVRDLDFSMPSTIANYYMERFRHLEVEEVIGVFLDTKCKKIRDTVLFTGTVNRALMSPREIFIEALKCGAVNIVLIHNHPSGDPAPSRDDIISTKKIEESGNMIGINLLDHIIIGDIQYTSMREAGIIK